MTWLHLLTGDKADFCNAIQSQAQRQNLG